MAGENFQLQEISLQDLDFMNDDFDFDSKAVSDLPANFSLGVSHVQSKIDQILKNIENAPKEIESCPHTNYWSFKNNSDSRRMAENVVQGLGSKNENSPVENLNAIELDNHIGSFLLSIRKTDGSEYEPDTLTSYHRGIDRYLKEKKSSYRIMFDKEFQNSRDILAREGKSTTQSGPTDRR
ncbi:hypothetical protein KUTeg_012139 [Tegillarca granosa]|uniref:Uncharacterized protein n=1 Tax=Tegillarca granosa TaxID=220873 RepID=A0ABQ9EYX0_TEGGR|nr:hypothetical protein KUTeg_012139 [Tegillarca granosa]